DATVPPRLPRARPRRGPRLLRRGARLPGGAERPGRVDRLQLLRAPARRAPAAGAHRRPRDHRGGRARGARAALRRRALHGRVARRRRAAPRRRDRVRDRAVHPIRGAAGRAGDDVRARPERERTRVQGLPRPEPGVRDL
ncbi:MAG: Putative dioxygenase, partial [uncultured Gemmatimonadaceae bacterium]